MVGERKGGKQLGRLAGFLAAPCGGVKEGEGNYAAGHVLMRSPAFSLVSGSVFSCLFVCVCVCFFFFKLFFYSLLVYTLIYFFVFGPHGGR